MKKVLLAGAEEAIYPSWSYQLSCAFEKLGFDVKNYNYRAHQLHRFKLTNKFLNLGLIKAAKKYKPDLLLVMKGGTLYPGTINKINKLGIKTVNWTLDEPFGKYLKLNKITNIEEYDYFFVFDPYYLKELKEINPHSYYLPCAGSPDVQKEIVPINQRKYICDVGFLGSHMPNREKLLNHLTNYDLKIWGYRWNNIEGPLKKHVQHNILTGKEMCKCFNLTKINLNIHFPHSIESVNLRTFEILATNSFQLCDYFKEIPNLFKMDKEIVCYKDAEELKEKIEYYLDNEEERLKIAKAGQLRTLNEHTVFHRIKEILRVMKNKI